MRRKYIIKSNKGYILMAVLLLSTVGIILVLAFSLRIPTAMRTTRLITESNRALFVADSGIQHGLSNLRHNPANFARINWTPCIVQGDLVGHYSVQFVPAGAANQVFVTSRGMLGALDTVSPDRIYETEERIEALVRVDRPGEFFAASAGRITIGAGTNIAEANVYADELIFQYGFSQSRVLSAYYSTSLTPHPWPTSNPPAIINENNDPELPNVPQQVPAITLPIVQDEGVIDQYRQAAEITEPDSGLIDSSNPPAFVRGLGNWGSHKYGNVYYCRGDLHLGTAGAVWIGSSANPGQHITLFVEGDVFIHNSIRCAPNPTGDRDNDNLFAIIATRNFFIHENAPDNIELLDVFLVVPTIAANAGLFSARGTVAKNDFTFQGGFVIGGAVEIAGVYRGQRTYRYNVRFRQPNNLFLPYMADIVRWREIPRDQW